MTTRRGAVAFGLVGATLLVAVLAAPAARADAAGPDGDDPARAEAAPKGPKLVVVADVAPTATGNSELRALIYDVARDRGYAPAGKLDVESVAGRASLMKGGSVTADASELVELRRALDVSVLVRASRDPSGATRVTVVSKRGTDSRLLGAAPREDELRTAIADLLPSIYHAESAPSAASGAPPAAGGDASAGALLLDPHTTTRAVSPREAWESRGGLRPSYGAMLLASGTEIHHVPFESTVAGRVVSGSGNATGVGGGIGVRVGVSYLPIPDPHLGTGGFVAFRFGAGLDTNVLYTRTPNGYDATHSVTYGNQALWVSAIPFHLGFAIAVGNFINDTTWRGMLLGLAYAPAAQFSMDLKNTSGKFRFNPAGVEASVDITKLEAGEDHDDAEPHLRLAVSGLVPLDDARPGFLSLGIGVIFY